MARYNGVFAILFLLSLSLWWAFLVTVLPHLYQQLDDFAWESLRKSKAKAAPRQTVTESFVISFDKGPADKFRERVHNEMKPLWMPAVDGSNQKILNSWAQLTGIFPPINASQSAKRGPAHAVGCYMAHWHLLRQLGHRAKELRPDLYFVFEDDASCVPNLVNRTLQVVRKLPHDWDMLFVGGKPFTRFKGPVQTFNDSTRDSLRRDICRGGFGVGDSPLAPDGTRHSVTEDQPYWQIKYMLNTHSYVINPLRIEHVLKVLEPKENVPIDILLAFNMQRDLNVFMPTRVFCKQDKEHKQPMNETEAWSGYFGFFLPGVTNLSTIHPGMLKHYKNYVWQTRMASWENCSY